MRDAEEMPRLSPSKSMSDASNVVFKEARAMEADLDGVHRLIRSWAERLAEHGKKPEGGEKRDSPWLSYTREHLDVDAARWEVYAVWHGEELAATVTVSEDGHEFAGRPEWTPSVRRPLYVSKFATKREFEDRNIYEWCMEWLIDEAKRRGCDALRYESFKAHPGIGYMYTDWAVVRGETECQPVGESVKHRIFLFERLVNVPFVKLSTRERKHAIGRRIVASDDGR